jgi:hypothetical protein
MKLNYLNLWFFENRFVLWVRCECTNTRSAVNCVAEARTQQYVVTLTFSRWCHVTWWSFRITWCLHLQVRKVTCIIFSSIFFYINNFRRITTRSLKTSLSFCHLDVSLSFCLHIISSELLGFYFWKHQQNLQTRSYFDLSRTKLADALYEDLHAFLGISRVKLTHNSANIYRRAKHIHQE